MNRQMYDVYTRQASDPSHQEPHRRIGPFLARADAERALLAAIAAGTADGGIVIRSDETD